MGSGKLKKRSPATRCFVDVDLSFGTDSDHRILRARDATLLQASPHPVPANSLTCSTREGTVKGIGGVIEALQKKPESQL